MEDRDMKQSDIGPIKAQIDECIARRRFLASGLATVCGMRLTNHTTAARSEVLHGAVNSTKQQWTWKQLSANVSGDEQQQPVARDPWNGMLAFQRHLYLFGGAFPKYGPPKQVADLTTLGTLNDLWQYDTQTAHWNRVQSDDGTSGFDGSSQRPSGRVLPAWVEVDGKFYLFGGLSVTSAGWRFRLMNDFWKFDPQKVKWELLEPDDQRALKFSTQVDGGRPSTLSAMGVCAIGKTIYFFGGWGGHSRKVVLSGQQWSFQTDRREWKMLGSGKAAKNRWPPKRYCPALTSWEDSLYLWGGRDSEDRSPQFYNDLWTFDPKQSRWEQIHRNGQVGPTARYGMGHARIGHHWYVFGGFANETGNAPQLNDLWRLDLRTGKWTEIQPNDGSKDISRTAARPSVRRVPAMTALNDSVYLFGGLDLASGPKHQGPLIGFNDLWRGTFVPKGRSTAK